MKSKFIMALVLALAMALIPATGVMASTTILDGTATVTVSEPIVISVVSGDGTYTAPVGSSPATWTVSKVGGGTLHLVLKATNTGAVGYQVSATVAAVGDPTGVTVAWSPATKWIAAGDNYDFTLTVTIAPDAPLTTNNYTFNFSR